MAITLGKNATSAPPFGTGIISATYTEECELIDISNRDNVGGLGGLPGIKVAAAGFVTKTWEIECHDPTGLVQSLTTAGANWSVMSITESVSVEGAVTYSVTAKEF